MISRVRRVGLVALPECSASVLYGLYDVLLSVGTVWCEITGEDHGTEPFEVRVVGPGRRGLRVAGNVLITPDESIKDAGRFDIVIVPDVHIDPSSDSRGWWEPVRHWLLDQYRNGATLCSVCTGSVVLAGTGLLDERVATTHWALVEHFERCYPRVRLEPARVLVPAGERIITGGGAGAWEDLALYLIGRFRDSAEAVRTAKVWVLGDRGDGQLPFAAVSRPRHHEDGIIADCQKWIAENYETDKPVATLAERSGLAERTFKRRFRAATGYTPVEYVQRLRIEEAKHLLETGDLSVEEIGSDVGYEDPSFFRKLFKRLTGVTPVRYRQRVRRIYGLAD